MNLDLQHKGKSPLGSPDRDERAGKEGFLNVKVGGAHKAQRGLKDLSFHSGVPDSNLDQVIGHLN
jgi:hypothetical protein